MTSDDNTLAWDWAAKYLDAPRPWRFGVRAWCAAQLLRELRLQLAEASAKLAAERAHFARCSAAWQGTFEQLHQRCDELERALRAARTQAAFRDAVLLAEDRVEVRALEADAKLRALVDFHEYDHGNGD